MSDKHKDEFYLNIARIAYWVRFWGMAGLVAIWLVLVYLFIRKLGN